MMRSRRSKLAGAVACVLLASGIGSARATDVWLAATEPPWRAVWGYPPNDWIDLFRSDAPWSRAASGVAVFELSKRAVLELSDADLHTVIDDLRRRRIKLAVQATPLISSRQVCGWGVEGYGPPDDMVEVATRLRTFGADLAYLTMDEPLWYGHLWSGPRACHSSIADIARQSTIKMRAVRRLFPRVVIGEDEPIAVPDASKSEWSNDVKSWFEAYHTAMGEPLGFFHADVVWQRPGWPALLQAVVAVAQRAHVRFGIIYNGLPTDATDGAWVDDAAAHFSTVEGKMHIRPSDGKLQSWMDHPRAMLPEDRRDTMTNLVLRYQAWISEGDHQGR